MNEVMRILAEIESGDASATGKLMPLVYAELRKLAAIKLAAEKPGQTLQPTGLVHEVFLRLLDVEQRQAWNSRGHFFAAAAEAMRRILIENARRKQAARHGGGRSQDDLDRLQIAAPDLPDPADLLDLDAALRQLSAADPEAARLVELRFFGGLSIPESAQVLGLSPRSADRLWSYARAYLYQALNGPRPEPGQDSQKNLA